jgi:hypothetical protein
VSRSKAYPVLKQWTTAIRLDAISTVRPTQTQLRNWSRGSHNWTLKLDMILIKELKVTWTWLILPNKLTGQKKSFSKPLMQGEKVKKQNRLTKSEP